MTCRDLLRVPPDATASTDEPIIFTEMPHGNNVLRTDLYPGSWFGIHFRPLLPCYRLSTRWKNAPSVVLLAQTGTCADHHPSSSSVVSLPRGLLKFMLDDPCR